MIGPLLDPTFDSNDLVKNPTPHRAIPIDGVENCRDLGGLTIQDGRLIETGWAFRSGQLHGITEIGLEAVRQLGISAVLDLRTEFEAGERPDRLPADAQLFQISANDIDMEALIEGLMSGDLDSDDLDDVIQQGYRSNLRTGQNAMRTLFELLAAGRPTIFHCAGGKDRTGVAAAVLLGFLGASRETIIDDYLMTNVQRKNRPSRERKEQLDQFDPRIAEGLLSRPRAAIKANICFTLDLVENEYGGYQRYVGEFLGVSARDQKALRSRLLGSPHPSSS